MGNKHHVNYTCRCGKAFDTPHQLKAHQRSKRHRPRYSDDAFARKALQTYHQDKLRMVK